MGDSFPVFGMAESMTGIEESNRGSRANENSDRKDEAQKWEDEQLFILQDDRDRAFK